MWYDPSHLDDLDQANCNIFMVSRHNRLPRVAQNGTQETWQQLYTVLQITRI